MVDALMLIARDFLSFIIIWYYQTENVNWCESECQPSEPLNLGLNARPEICMRLKLSYIKISRRYKQASTEEC